MKPAPKPPLRTYWWHGHANMGDLLGNEILKRYVERTTVWADPILADLVCTGSLIDSLPVQRWPGIVAGAGQLHAWRDTDLRDATVLGVRGPLTAKRIATAPGTHITLGDPGILASEFVKPHPHTRHEIGVVPHWSDKELWPKELAKAEHGKYAKPVHIDVAGDPMTVMSQIASCKKVVASSLHALIVADSFGIPRRAEPFPTINSRNEGGAFKYEDWNAAIGVEKGFGVLRQANHTKVQRMIEAQTDMFIELKRVLDAS